MLVELRNSLLYVVFIYVPLRISKDARYLKNNRRVNIESLEGLIMKQLKVSIPISATSMTRKRIKNIKKNVIN